MTQHIIITHLLILHPPIPPTLVFVVRIPPTLVFVFVLVLDLIDGSSVVKNLVGVDRLEELAATPVVRGTVVQNGAKR